MLRRIVLGYFIDQGCQIARMTPRQDAAGLACWVFLKEGPPGAVQGHPRGVVGVRAEGDGLGSSPKGGAVAAEELSPDTLEPWLSYGIARRKAATLEREPADIPDPEAGRQD